MPEKNNLFRPGLDIAIIGMAGRFPGAKNINQFWENLKKGIESIYFFSQPELENIGASPGQLNDPNFVKAGGVLEDIQYFDAAFFDYTPREAEILDPQIRIFHECVWTALEDAGYVPDNFAGSIGLYAGASNHSDWELIGQETSNSFVNVQYLDKDHLTARISHKLNLTGPSFVIETQCSTSLVAVHLACQGLLSGECDMAAAGGTSIISAFRYGYYYQEGMLFAPDGHCRTFDKKASGIVLGNGAGIVVLKRIQEAVADNDHIYAIIKGTAINNDGKHRISYSAPSPDGQTEVIRMALRIAQTPPESISFVETHGTGTSLGDPIEIKGLTAAFNTDKKGFCRIGSVKTNVGHVDNAAGIASLIKTALALKYKLIPPSLHFNTPNPKIDFENTPFVVNRELTEWKKKNYPLRAGVSSFGIGGTNAHAVLEECPDDRGQKTEDKGQITDEREYQLILLSAKTTSALDKMTENLAEYFKENLLNHGNQKNPMNPGPTLADAAYTLQVGREAFNHRRMVVCADIHEAIAALKPGKPQPGQGHRFILKDKTRERSIVFLFAGLGAQYVNMGRQLYETLPYFRQEMDRCFEILDKLTDFPSKEILYPRPDCRGGSPCPPQSPHRDSPGSPCPPSAPGQGDPRPPVTRHSSPDIHRFQIAQIAIFIFEYALAQLLIKWGIQPDALMGYSFGEYTAACISGIFSLQDALDLLVTRGKLIDTLPPGGMLSIPLTRKDLEPLLTDQLSIAIDNGSSCIIAGPGDAVNTFENRMKEKRLMCMRLQASHALHSKMMEPIARELTEKVRQVKRNRPQIPLMSNVSGKWLTPEQAKDPDYWSTHLKTTVQFAAGMEELTKMPTLIFIEVGPGRDLSTLALRYIEGNPNQRLVHLVRPAAKQVPDIAYLLSKAGQLWLYGVNVDWTAFHEGQQGHRIPLPTYPFERKTFPALEHLFKINVRPGAERLDLRKKPDIADWFYLPSWTNSVLLPVSSSSTFWLMFLDECHVGNGLVKRLKREGHHVITIRKTSAFTKISDEEYTLHPGNRDDYLALFRELEKTGKIPTEIVHLMGISGEERCPVDMKIVKREQELGFYSLLYMVKAINQLDVPGEFRITVVSDNMLKVTGQEHISPGKATLLAPINVIPQEHVTINCRVIDVILPGHGTWQENMLWEQLAAECMAPSNEKVVAYRGDQRWLPNFTPVRLEQPEGECKRLKHKGVYLITGGLGGLGLIFARYLASRVQARLILTGRSPFPDRQDWDQWLVDHGANDSISQKILKLKKIEALGGEVLVLSADAANQEHMQAVILQAEKRFNTINGVIYGAGLLNSETIRLVNEIEKSHCEQQFQAKIYGLLVLEKVLKGKSPDFCLLLSSLSSILGGLGLVAYSAGNLFMDAFVQQYNRWNGSHWLSLNLEHWEKEEVKKRQASVGTSLAQLGLTTQECDRVFERVLHWKTTNRLVNSSGDLKTRINQWVNLETVKKEEKTGKKSTALFSSRPQLSSPYQAPTTPCEQAIAEIWKDILGYDKIGTRDDFIELGGDSLKAIILTSKIHKQLSVKAPLIEIFKRKTIRQLASYVEQCKNTQYAGIEPMEKKEYYPLSSAQKRLFFLQQIDLNNTGYNMSFVFPLGKNIKKNQLESSIKKVIQRHNSLHTSFIKKDGLPVQKVQNPNDVEFKIEYFDLTTEAPGEKEGDPTTPLISSFIRPFDLSQAPLIRSGLIRLPDDSHCWIVDIHHIVSDGTSQTILTEDFLLLDKGNKPGPLRIQYTDFAQWQNRLLESGAIQSQEDYWLNLYRDSVEIPRLNLIHDYQRPEVFTFAGNTHSFMLGPEQASRFKQLSFRCNGTLYMNFLAALNTLFYKYTHQTDIIIGSSIAGRHHFDLQHIVGMFVNTLPMRNYPTGQKTYESFLYEIIANAFNALENQDVQFEELVDKLDVERDPSRNPLFDINIVVQNFWKPGEENSIRENPGQVELLPAPNKNLSLMDIEFRNPTSKFDMTFSISEIGDDIAVNIEYYNAIFKLDTIKRLAGHLTHVIRAVIEDPSIRLKNIEIISEKEKQQVLYEYNNTSQTYNGTKTIHELFEEQMGKTPDHIALIGYPGIENRTCTPHMIYISYRQLNEKSGQLANLLLEKGVRADMIVGIMMERSPEMIIGLLGILKAGGAYLPIDPGYPEERIDFMLADSAAKILLTPDTINRLSTPLDFSILTSMPTCQADCASLAYVIYTSGSTGRAKGVLIRHQGVVNMVRCHHKVFADNPGSRFSQAANITFDAMAFEVWPALLAGAALYIADNETRLDPARMKTWLIKHQITISLQSTHMAELLLEEQWPKNTAVPEILCAAGEKLTFYPTGSYPFRFYNLYGPTEDTVWTTWTEVPVNPIETQIPKFPPIGKPINNKKVYILSYDLKLQPPGIGGELCITGQGLARGYLNNPELTKEKFDHDLWDLWDYQDKKIKKNDHDLWDYQGIPGFYRSYRSNTSYKPYMSYITYRSYIYKTGDLARWLSGGSIEFLGRIDSQVKIRGFRIELGEIESLLINHEEIKEAVVICKKNETRDKYLCAYFVAHREIPLASLREYLSRKLPGYMLPAHIIQLNHLPLTPNGKIDKKYLSHRSELRPTLETAYTPPGNNLEKIMVNIWKEVLNLDKVGIHDNFFDLGGNSLSVIKLNSLLKKELGKDIPVLEMFRYTTIHSLSTHLSKEENKKAFSDEKILEAVNSREYTIQMFIEDEDEDE